MRTDAGPAIEEDVRAYFAGHDVESVEYDLGFPRRRRIAGFRVLVIEPGPRLDLWSYVTVGCWAVGNRLEFVIASRHREETIVGLLGKVAYYHATHELDRGQSMPIGGPWLPGSACDHLLLSESSLHSSHVRFARLLPVTASEIEFQRRHGAEALAQRIDPTDPLRQSVAP